MVDFKDLVRRTASDKILSDKVFNIATNSNHDGYQSRISSVVYKFLGKKLQVEPLHLHGRAPSIP